MLISIRRRLHAITIGLAGLLACSVMGAEQPPTAPSVTANQSQTRPAEVWDAEFSKKLHFAYIYTVKLQRAGGGVAEQRPAETTPGKLYCGGLGDRLIVEVVNLEGWLDRVSSTGQSGKRLGAYQLVPVLDGVRLPGIHCESIDSYTVNEKVLSDEFVERSSRTVTVSHLRFHLVRTEASKAAWNQLLNRPRMRREVTVTLGFEPELDLPYTAIDRRPLDGRTVLQGGLEDSDPPHNRFFLEILPLGWLIIGGVLVLAAIGLFSWLVRESDIIRDTSAPRRPDTRWPYSLARSQMAFWFFLVVTAYLFLWIVLGARDTITPSVLGLMGIAAGTALGAALVDAQRPSQSSGKEVPPVDLRKRRKDIIAELKVMVASIQKQIEDLKAARGNIVDTDLVALEANAKKLAEAEQLLDQRNRQIAYFQWPRIKGLVYDLLGERQVISFHRFQILVWTVLLGVVFVVDVVNELAMPEFSATLLGLMGISAGTYIGFKIPPAQSP